MIDLTQTLLIILILFVAILIQQNHNSNNNNNNNNNNHVKFMQYLTDSKQDNNNNNQYQRTKSFYHTAKKRIGEVDTAKLIFQADQYRFAMVTDMDLKSRDPDKFLWKSFFKSGTLVRNNNNNNNNNNRKKNNNVNEKNKGKYSIVWDNDVQTLTSKTATKNRSMELSALVRYHHWLLAFCDYTGLVFKILPDTSSVFQRHAVVSKFYYSSCLGRCCGQELYSLNPIYTRQPL